MRRPLGHEQDEILNKARELTATTLKGHRARARMLLAWDGEMKNSAMERQDVDAEMQWLLVCDLLGNEHADTLQSRDLEIYCQAVAAGWMGVASVA